MAGSTGADNTSNTGAMSSWSLRTEGTISRPSWMSDSESDAMYMRISIGAFMQGRTEALGTLEGDNDVVRVSYYTSASQSFHGVSTPQPE